MFFDVIVVNAVKEGNGLESKPCTAVRHCNTSVYTRIPSNGGATLMAPIGQCMAGRYYMYVQHCQRLFSNPSINKSVSRKYRLDL